MKRRTRVLLADDHAIVADITVPILSGLRALRRFKAAPSEVHDHRDATK